ncbi:MAG: tetratricopeptide repeat protein [Planctomycetota bacterium]|jgi:tetratricopeptide (TPR) repeat protein
MASYEIARARLLCEEGMLDAAESCYLKTLESLGVSLGYEHAYTAKVRVEIAALCVRRQRYDQAESLTRDAIAVQQKVYGEDHHFLIPAWIVMAHVHDHRGEQEKAREMIEKAQLAAGRKLEPAHPLARKLAREARTLGIRASK